MPETTPALPSWIPNFTPTAPNSKLTPAFLVRYAAGLQAGLYPAQAARDCGLHEDTVKAWRKQGREDREANPEAQTPYTIFLDVEERAVLDCEYIQINNIMAAASKDGRLALEFLARRFPDRWGRKDRGGIQVSAGDVGAEIQNFLIQLQQTNVTIQLPPATNGPIGYQPTGGPALAAGPDIVELVPAFGGATGMAALGTQDQDGSVWSPVGEV